MWEGVWFVDCPRVIVSGCGWGCGYGCSVVWFVHIRVRWEERVLRGSRDQWLNRFILYEMTSDLVESLALRGCEPGESIRALVGGTR